MLCSVVSANIQAENNKSRVMIGFKKGNDKSIEKTLKTSGADIHYHFSNLNVFAASVPQAALEGLQNNPSILYIEDDVKRYPSAQEVPYGIDSVQARDVWDQAFDGGDFDSGTPVGTGRKICIIDSGLYTAHEDISATNVSGLGDDWSNDCSGHGTHVAGTIAAVNNEIGVIGVSPDVSLYIVKIFDGPSCGWSYSSNLIDSSNKCSEAGANIINMSLGGRKLSVSERDAFAAHYNNNILSIAAAGNNGDNTKLYPASYDSVISVAAVDNTLTVADFSQSNDQVELSAPGVNVLSTVPFTSVNQLLINGLPYIGGHIEFSAFDEVTATIVDGNYCGSRDIPKDNSWSGKIVLCQRGTSKGKSITFFEKVSNSELSGAVGVAIYNNEPYGFSGTLGEGNSSAIPAISLSQENGQYILNNLIGSSSTLTTSAPSVGNGYQAWSGTSMAAPHVSGVAALAWSADPSLTNAEIRAALISTAMDLGVTGKDSVYGHGLVQAYGAWQAVGESVPTNLAPVADFSFVCDQSQSCTFTDASTDPDGNTDIFSYSWAFGDGNESVDINPDHTYSDAGSYNVSLTVTDSAGLSDTTTKTVVAFYGTEDTVAPVISAVNAEKTKGVKFVITWNTNEPATSVVNLIDYGSYTRNSLVTEHSMGFTGSRGAIYEYTVESTDAAGNTEVSAVYSHQN